MTSLISLAISIIVLYILLQNFDKFFEIVKNLTLGLLNLMKQITDKLNPPL